MPFLDSKITFKVNRAIKQISKDGGGRLGSATKPPESQLTTLEPG